MTVLGDGTFVIDFASVAATRRCLAEPTEHRLVPSHSHRRGRIEVERGSALRLVGLGYAYLAILGINSGTYRLSTATPLRSMRVLLGQAY